MATSAEELERMVIRLIGDSSHYIKELDKVKEATRTMAQDVKDHMNNVQTSQKAVERGVEYNRSLAANSMKMETRNAESAAKSLEGQKQKYYEKNLKEDESRQRKLDKVIQDQENRSSKDRRNILFNEAKERQKLLDQKIAEDQKRFQQSNKLALQTDRQREKDRVQAERETDRAKKQKDQQEKTNDRNAIRESVRLGEQIQATVKGVGIASAAIAAPIGYVGKISVEEYGKFNQALTESTSMMKVTEGQTEAVSEAVLNLSKTSKFGPAELASAFRLLAGSGLDAEQSIKALPIVTTFATAANIDLGKAIESASQAQTVMGLNSDDTTTRLTNLTRVTDVLTEASRLSGKEANAFASALTHDAGAAAHSMGKSIEETTALMVAFSRQGISGEMAGAYASKFTRFAADRSVQNQQVFKDLGVNVFDKDTGKMRNYADILDDMGSAFKNLSDQGRTAVLHMMGFEPRTQSAMMAVLNASGKVREFQKNLENAGGTAQSVADKQLASFNNQIQMMKNNVTVLLIGIGKQLAPALLVAAKIVQYFTAAWEALPPVVKETTVVFAVLVGGIAAFIATAVAAAIAFNFAFGGVPLLILAGVAAVTLFLGVIAGIAAAVFQQAGGFEMLKQKALEMWEWLAPIRLKVELFFITFYRVGSKLIEELTTFITTKFEQLNKKINWDKVLKSLEDMVDFSRFTLTNLQMVWDYAWITVKYTVVSSLNSILNNLFTFLPKMHGGWIATMMAIYDSTKRIFSSMGVNLDQYFKNIFYGITGQFHKINWGAVWKDINKEVEVDLSGINIQGLTQLEEKLKFEMDKAKKVMDEKFKKWKEDNQTEVLDLMPEIEHLGEKFKEEGEDNSKQYLKGIDKGIKHAQSALTGSAEALSRILAYRDISQEPDDVIRNGKKILSPLSGSAEGNKSWQEHLNLMRGIKENGDNLLKKDPVKVENANLAN